MEKVFEAIENVRKENRENISEVKKDLFNLHLLLKEGNIEKAQLELEALNNKVSNMEL